MAGGQIEVLFVASECAPLVKTGGLADVIGALPRALAAIDCRVRVLIPAYRGVIEKVGTTETIDEIDDLFGGTARLIAGRMAHLDLLLLDAPHLYDRPGGPYQDGASRDWPDNHLRFGALGRVAARIGEMGMPDGWRPDLVHAHDWQAALVPLLLAHIPDRPVTVTTIHNIAFQGNFDADIRRTLDLPESGFTPAGYEFWGGISLLKSGIVYSDAITTVSPSHARELTSPEFGFGMEGVIAERGDRLHGILNGIDLDGWNPETDQHIARFSVRRLQARQKNRAALIDEFGIDPGHGPVFAVISRLSWQKGLDLLLERLPESGALLVLGSGDPELEDGFRAAAERRPEKVGVRIGYDEVLSHRIYAGADAMLVPSRYEPCGLTQLYAMRYGALPIVARTGGLADTVIDANDAALNAGVATGFHFAPGSEEALSWAMARAAALFRDRTAWAKAQRNAMRLPTGWDRSAARYRQLYEKLLAQKT